MRLKSSISGLLLFFYQAIFRRFLSFQVYSYLVIGVFNTAWNILLFHVFYYHILPPRLCGFMSFLPTHTLALILAFCLTAPMGFYLMRNFTFTAGNTQAQPQSVMVQFVKYIYVLLQGLLLEFLIVYSMVELMHIENLINTGATIAKICASAIVATLNFFLQRHFTFASGSKK